MKKIFLSAILCVASIAFAGCGNGRQEKENTAQTAAAASFDEETEQLSEEELLAIMQAAAGQQLEKHVYVDMDHNGTKELTGVCPDERNFYRTWCCSSDGGTCFLAHQNNVDMDGCEIELLDLGAETHVVINAYRMMGTVKNYSIIALKDNNISCLVSNNYGYVRMTEEGDITLDVEAYDGMYDPDTDAMILHTWKDTYLYFDGEAYREYVAAEITEEDFLNFRNAQTIKDAIDSELRQEDTIKLEYAYFIRKNGIMHIQCNVYGDSGVIQYGYYTVRFSGDALDERLGEYISGQMSPRFSDLDVADTNNAIF